MRDKSPEMKMEPSVMCMYMYDKFRVVLIKH